MAMALGWFPAMHALVLLAKGYGECAICATAFPAPLSSLVPFLPELPDMGGWAMDLSLDRFFFRTRGFHDVFFRPRLFFSLGSRLRSLSFVAFVRWCGDGRFVGLACLCCFHRTRDLSLDRTALSPRGKRRGGGALFQPMRTPSQMRPHA